MSFQDELSSMLKEFQSIPRPEPLVRLLTSLRHEMEVPSAPCEKNFRNGQQSGAPPPSNTRSFGGSSSNVPAWRSGVAATMKKVSSNETFQTIHKSSSNGSLASTNSSSGRSPKVPSTTGGSSPKPGSATTSFNSSSTTNSSGRYQSKFTSKGNIEEKILNTIIGNKLNSFTASTYNDTRDFIYQILDSGEIEFIKDFVEKVFMKATVEELYCALFAKLLAEVAHHYPIMYEEMNRYHTEFLKVFEDVQEGATDEASIKKRQYRMGYGQFISELASREALPKEHLLSIVKKVCEKVNELSAEKDKMKVVEEFIDCLVRLSTNLRECSSAFYGSVKGDLQSSLLPTLQPLIDRTAGERPSLSSKARYALMDLCDLFV